MSSLPIAGHMMETQLGTKFQSMALSLRTIHDTGGYHLPEIYDIPGQVC